MFPMVTFLIALSTWLHTLATVVFVGPTCDLILALTPASALGLRWRHVSRILTLAS
jgi:hypothetical protein